MALVNHDKVEEIRGEFLVDVLVLFSAGHRLVERQIDLKGLVDGAVADLGHSLTKGLERAVLCLIHQHVAVRQEQDAFLLPGFPESPDDLEGGVGLAGPGSHDQQDSVLAAGDGLHRAIDGNHLVVAGCHAPSVVVIGLFSDSLGRGLQALPLTVALP